MLRISEGKYKNKRLKTPDNIRPVRERVKLAIFSILFQRIKNKDCLDLFAGCGSLGFEAFSLGAKSVTFVDNAFDSIKYLNINKDNLLLEKDESGKIKIIKTDATRYVNDTDAHYDVIFMDPPYNMQIRHIIKIIDKILNENGIIVYLHSTSKNPMQNRFNENLKIIDTRKYGATTVDFMTRV